MLLDQFKAHIATSRLAVDESRKIVRETNELIARIEQWQSRTSLSELGIGVVSYLVSPATAQSQAPVAERPIALPPARQQGARLWRMPISLLPVDFDVRGPNFSRDMLQWSFQVRSEIDELVAGSNAAIVNSNALIAEADRLLARK